MVQTVLSQSLAAVTFSGYWVRVQGVCMAGTARHFHRLVHQLLEGTCLLDIGSRWVLVHQVLSGLGDREREMSYSSLEVSVWLNQNETGIEYCLL